MKEQLDLTLSYIFMLEYANSQFMFKVSIKKIKLVDQ